MSQNDDQPAVVRRVLTRRTRGQGMGNARATGRSEGVPLGTDDDQFNDDVEAAIDPERMNELVEELHAPEPPRRISTGRMTPEAYLEQKVRDSMTRDERLGVIEKALLMGATERQLVDKFGLSPSSIQKDRAEIRRRQRQIVKTMDVDQVVGEGIAFYDALAQQGMRIATDRQTPVAMKLAAIRTSASANNDKIRFMNSAGVFEVHRVRRGEGEAAQSDVQKLMDDTANFMRALLESEGKPVPAGMGGFTPLTMEEPEDPENEIL